MRTPARISGALSMRSRPRAFLRTRRSSWTTRAPTAPRTASNWTFRASRWYAWRRTSGSQRPTTLPLAAPERPPEFTFFASRTVKDADPYTLDTAGDELHVSGVAWQRGRGTAAAAATTP